MGTGLAFRITMSIHSPAVNGMTPSSICEVCPAWRRWRCAQRGVK